MLRNEAMNGFRIGVRNLQTHSFRGCFRFEIERKHKYGFIKKDIELDWLFYGQITVTSITNISYTYTNQLVTFS